MTGFSLYVQNVNEEYVVYRTVKMTPESLDRALKILEVYPMDTVVIRLMKD